MEGLICPLCDFKILASQSFNAQGERGFHENSNTRIAVGELQFLQGIRALADKVRDERVREGTVHVANVLKVQNNSVVAVNKRVYAGEPEGSRFFTVCQEVSTLFCQLDN